MHKKLCINKKTVLILFIIFTSISFIFATYFISSSSHIINSRATYIPPNNLSLFGILGLKNAISESTFNIKFETLKKLIDENPEDESLRRAFSAFIQSHIVIAGGYLEGYAFPAENLYHYIYKKGENKDISNSYLKLVLNSYSSLDNFMSEEISYSLNNEKSIISGFSLKNIGYSTLHDTSNIPWSNMQILVQPSVDKLNFALGRHTLFFSSQITNSTTSVDSTSIPLQTKSLIDILIKNNIPYSIQKIDLSLNGDITLFDKYKFNVESNNGAGVGFAAKSKELSFVIQIANKLGGLKDISKYMGESRFSTLKDGIIDISNEGLIKLEDLKLANSYEITGTLKAKDIEPFSVYLIIRKQFLNIYQFKNSWEKISI